MTAIITAALLTFGFEPMWAYQVVKASERHGVDAVEVAGLILSEHNGVLTPETRKAKNKTTNCTGLGQIAPWWAKKLGFTKADLENPMHNIEMTAKLVRILQDEHARHRNSKHHWLAHYKCGWKSHDTCGGPTRRTLKWMYKVEAEVERRRSAAFTGTGPTLATVR